MSARRRDPTEGLETKSRIFKAPKSAIVREPVPARVGPSMLDWLVTYVEELESAVSQSVIDAAVERANARHEAMS
jgi:hypothetical protein